MKRILILALCLVAIASAADAKRHHKPASIANPTTLVDVTTTLSASQLHWLALCHDNSWAPLGDGSEVCVNCVPDDGTGAPNCYTTIRRIP